MAESSQLPTASSPPSPPSAASPGRRGVLAVAVTVAAVVAGTAVLGLVAGVAWAAVAPRALVVVLGRGSGDVVNPETNAFIAQDGWFALVTVFGGVISGLLGHALAVRRHGAPAMAAILVGGLAGALVAKWVGQQSGAAAFNRSLSAGRVGTLLHAPLMLGGAGVLAFWALAAGTTAGGIEAVLLLRRRQAARASLQSYGPAPVAGAEGPPATR